MAEVELFVGLMSKQSLATPSGHNQYPQANGARFVPTPPLRPSPGERRGLEQIGRLTMTIGQTRST